MGREQKKSMAIRRLCKHGPAPGSARKAVGKAARVTERPARPLLLAGRGQRPLQAPGSVPGAATRGVGSARWPSPSQDGGGPVWPGTRVMSQGGQRDQDTCRGPCGHLPGDGDTPPHSAPFHPHTQLHFQGGGWGVTQAPSSRMWEPSASSPSRASSLLSAAAPHPRTMLGSETSGSLGAPAASTRGSHLKCQPGALPGWVPESQGPPQPARAPGRPRAQGQVCALGSEVASDPRQSQGVSESGLKGGLCPTCWEHPAVLGGALLPQNSAARWGADPRLWPGPPGDPRQSLGRPGLAGTRFSSELCSTVRQP